MSVQVSNWLVFVACNILVGAGSHKLNVCFSLHWWSLGRVHIMSLGLQICWSNNMETLVLLGISIETGDRLGFGWGAMWKLLLSASLFT